MRETRSENITAGLRGFRSPLPNARGRRYVAAAGNDGSVMMMSIEDSNPERVLMTPCRPRVRRMLDSRD